MKIRIAFSMAAALAMLTAAPTAYAEHHESKGKGKGYEKTSERSHPDETESAEKEGRGRGDEMRARRDERKDIMSESKENAEPGTPRKGKKPWWRFWETDEAE